MGTSTTAQTLTLDPAEGHLLTEAESLAVALGTAERRPRLVGPDGREIEIPPAIFDALAIIADALRHGDGVSVIPLRHMLTTNEAAELLNVSRPHLVSLLLKQEIPFEFVGTHRRVRLHDLLAYRARQDERREQALGNIVRHGEELGLPY